MSTLKSLSDFLVVEDRVTACDLILVLAGRPERKLYGLKLLQRGVAPRLLLSVGRSEVRYTASLIAEGSELLALRDRTPPGKRHFWVDIESKGRFIHWADLKRIGTYEELQALAALLSSRPPATMALVSTSIHLRRVRFCCAKIPFFAARKVYFWPVPEEENLFQRNGWWKRPRDFRYVIAEYVKLAGYRLRYR